MYRKFGRHFVVFCLFMTGSILILAQGVTVGSASGVVTDNQGEGLPGVTIALYFENTGTSYNAVTRENGGYNLPNLRVGGPYSMTVSMGGFSTQKKTDIFINLGQNQRFNFKLEQKAVSEEMTVVASEQDEVFNSERTGAATAISTEQIEQLPTIKRSTRDLTRLDPRSDGNFSFGGKNWLYNNISLDGSYFNNPFGLDDPAPGGQANAEPVPFDAIAQVQVSIAPFDVREGGFTGAGINQVTKSGTNNIEASIYTFTRSEDFVGDSVRGETVLNPSMSFSQTGIRASGPIKKNKVFFFFNAEVVRREDPGSNFQAGGPGLTGATVSRVQASDLDAIRQRMMDVYGYDTGAYEGYTHATDNDKLIFKIDWNINDTNTLSFRFNRLEAIRDLGPHPFAISINNTGRSPSVSTLPFQNSGYAINNNLDSYALEINSMGENWANRAFLSYNKFRDFRTPFSEPFPTIEIGVDGVTYTTLGHEPFSVNNVLDQDVLQITDNFTFYKGAHSITVGANYERFKFMNSFNLFYHGLFMVPAMFGPGVGGTTFFSMEEFFDYTDPNSPNFRDFNAEVENQLQNPYKADNVEVGQFALYAQDEYMLSNNLNLTYGLRVDIPIYSTDVPTNTFTQGLTLLDENGNPEVIDASKFPSTSGLFSPRIGFNWDMDGDQTKQLRGGTGIFTGRLPFVWIGNTVSNQGPEAEFPSFDINATDPDFEWPQVWTTNLAYDTRLPWDLKATFEGIYSKDINGIYVRNANLANPVGTIPGADGRVRYDPGANQLNNLGGGGVYVLDNTDEGYNYNFTSQLFKTFESGLVGSLSYAYSIAKNQMSSTEIASFLWQFNAVQGNPNQPELSYSEFGHRHRIVGAMNYKHMWNDAVGTSVGVFLEIAEGAASTAGARSRYSFTYAGDVNGDGQGGNDLIYIPNDSSEILLDPIMDSGGNILVTSAEQWAALDAFIEQDDYLSANRGTIADRFGGVNPWFWNMDIKVLQDVVFTKGDNRHTFQVSLDILNFANLLSDDWGVREIANPSATSPLLLTRFDESGTPVFQFPGVAKTHVDDISINSRWQAQLGIRYIFN